MASQQIDSSTTDDESTGTDSERTVQPIAGLAFWSAVVLPFVQLGLLVGGLETWRTSVVLAVLFVVNLFALVVGHRYGLD